MRLTTACSTRFRLMIGGLAAWLVAATTAGADERIQFNRDVRPILSDRCFYCHGPDANHREADLRLDVRDDAVAAGAIVAGKPHESALVERILSSDPDLVMPPPASNKKLTAKERDVLKRWVEQGAEYQQHWAYEPPVKAAISADENGVDVLVAKRLAEVKLSPSREADCRTLIRRLYSDLLGLPPTPEEVAEFENDARPDAYERLVERTLANPHFGERMAMGWLDVVRFADTIGYHSDNPRNIWPYRDWVVKSFNDNKRFDRFTIEQIAGDLLPDATIETRVGSAFNRLLLTTEEGGAQPKDYESRMLTDRVRAIGAAWLGQTTGCAQCHDHKFDPFTMRDFYSLGAFFADVKEPIVGRREEGMLVATVDDEQRLAALDAQLRDLRQKLKGASAKLDAAQAAWETRVAEEKLDLVELVGGDSVSPDVKQAAQAAAAALKRESKARNAKQRETIQRYFRTYVDAAHQAEFDALAELERERKSFYDGLPKCLVSISLPTKRTVRILPRGDWMNETGEVVRPALPHYLPQLDVQDRELTRLDLAQWLVSRQNPLTARAVMNRLWKQFFGLGLSKVLDDLGAQGEPPPNAALLDWLACEFMDSGWDVKHMVRVIVTSRVYRQVSTATPELLAADPDNREHARQSAFRFDAELVRDYALAVSGLLSPKIGGPSVKPYQPEGYWENLNFPTRDYHADQGESQYRRGLYVWWQRTFLHPSLLAFDAPSREESCAERSRSNIPQQALVLLNDPSYVEAARGLAMRLLTEAPKSDAERIDWAWRRALQRAPRADEREAIVKLLAKHRAAYAANPESAAAFVAVGLTPVSDSVDRVELAVWMHVARVLLNLHETITRS